MNRKFFIFIFLLIFNSTIFSFKKAIFLNPVTDLFWVKLSTLGGDFLNKYSTNMPLAPVDGVDSNLRNCKYRAGQALFNEMARIVECDEKTGEVCVECENMLSYNKKSKKFGVPQRLWTLEQNLTILDELNKKFLESFPKPFSYSSKDWLNDSQVITLIYPWYHKANDKTYSAGTRVVRVPKRDDKNFYCVKFCDFLSEKIFEARIPKEIGFVCSKEIDIENRIKKFIEVLQLWASESDGILPYVWCGHSFLEKIEGKGFEQSEEKFFGKKINYWTRDNIEKRPSSGLNCSSMVLRAALACGIPYFFKTSDQLYKNGDQMLLKKGKKIEAGFLIAYQGRVLVVADPKKGRIISASGYEYNSNPGKMNSFRLDELFIGISEIEDLGTLYESGGMLRFKQYKIGSKNFSDEFKIFDIRLLFDLKE